MKKCEPWRILQFGKLMGSCLVHINHSNVLLEPSTDCRAVLALVLDVNQLWRHWESCSLVELNLPLGILSAPSILKTLFGWIFLPPLLNSFSYGKIRTLGYWYGHCRGSSGSGVLRCPVFQMAQLTLLPEASHSLYGKTPTLMDKLHVISNLILNFDP